MNPLKADIYKEVLRRVITQIERSRIEALSQVNQTLLKTYWEIGKILSENAGYGKSAVRRLSEDLRRRYPENKGFSERNLWNMKRFYETYQKLQTVSAESLFSICWSNHITIFERIKNTEEILLYLCRILQRYP